MTTKNQGSTRTLPSNIAVIAVLGYASSYIPSLLAYWEETWYPHGRELRVIMPDQNPDPMVAALPTETNEQYPAHQGDAGGGWALFNPPLPPVLANQANQPDSEIGDASEGGDSVGKNSEGWASDSDADVNHPFDGVGADGLATKARNGDIDET